MPEQRRFCPDLFFQWKYETGKHKRIPKYTIIGFNIFVKFRLKCRSLAFRGWSLALG